MNTSIRYDSAELLTDFVELGRFPRIHDAVFQEIRDEIPAPGVILDMGSSTGLLSQRLSRAGYEVLAVEAASRSIQDGVQAGAYAGVTVMGLRLTPATWRGWLDRIADYPGHVGRRTVVCRRVLPELYSALGPHDYVGLLDGLADWAGAGGHLVMEARLASSISTHPLGFPGAERDSLPGSWCILRERGRLATFTTQRRYPA